MILFWTVAAAIVGSRFWPKWHAKSGKIPGIGHTVRYVDNRVVAHRDGPFLVYTRRGANNDHVFRHRAPLFIAEFDPDRMVAPRATERILGSPTP